MKAKQKPTPLTSNDFDNTLFSPRWYLENMLYIVDKRNNLIKFKLNEEQDRMLQHIEYCLKHDLPIRMIVLKARQIGATTFFAGLGFWYAAMQKNRTYGIVAHLMKSAESIFQKCKVFYNNLPTELQPATTQMSGEGITFDKKNGMGINSKIQFATVSEGVFRGQTLGYLHLSECAFWEGNVQAIENSLAPTVAIAPGTIIVRESTANGYNTFKDDWDRAISGKSEYTPFFFGWHQHSEYRLKLPTGFTLTEEEELLKTRFSLDDEQLMWRRYQINNNYNENPMWFAQENPMTPEEAFVSSGTGVFDAETILEGYRLAKEPKKVVLQSVPMFEKLLVWEEPQVEEKKIYAKRMEYSEEEQRYVEVETELVIEEQLFQHNYTIGIDTSGMGADKNQIVVIKNATKEMVARFEKKNISEELLAKIAVEIACMYNNALIAPEINYSHAITGFILNEGYKHMYMMENMARQDNQLTPGIQYGFRTTSATKAPIIAGLRAKLTSNPSIIPDREFWNEAEYYIIEDTALRKMNAAQGHHDDIIMAAAIAMYVSDSFQAKQSPTIIKKPAVGVDVLLAHGYNHNKKTKMRKGIYKNNA